MTRYPKSFLALCLSSEHVKKDTNGAILVIDRKAEYFPFVKKVTFCHSVYINFFFILLHNFYILDYCSFTRQEKSRYQALQLIDKMLLMNFRSGSLVIPLICPTKTLVKFYEVYNLDFNFPNQLYILHTSERGK
jgi:hypothetical protein